MPVEKLKTSSLIASGTKTEKKSSGESACKSSESSKRNYAEPKKQSSLFCARTRSCWLDSSGKRRQKSYSIRHRANSWSRHSSGKSWLTSNKTCISWKTSTTSLKYQRRRMSSRSRPSRSRRPSPRSRRQESFPRQKYAKSWAILVWEMRLYKRSSCKRKKMRSSSETVKRQSRALQDRSIKELNRQRLLRLKAPRRRMPSMLSRLRSRMTTQYWIRSDLATLSILMRVEWAYPTKRSMGSAVARMAAMELRMRWQRPSLRRRCERRSTAWWRSKDRCQSALCRAISSLIYSRLCRVTNRRHLLTREMRASKTTKSVHQTF